MNLLPCPHCHKTTEDIDDMHRRAVQKTCYTETNAHVVQCCWCGMSGPIFDTNDEAIKAWNELPRQPPSPILQSPPGPEESLVQSTPDPEA